MGILQDGTENYMVFFQEFGLKKFLQHILTKCLTCFENQKTIYEKIFIGSDSKKTLWCEFC